jgi:PadR family transcriptional regulator, regulatory protein PadR
MHSIFSVGMIEEIILLTILRLEDRAYGAAIRAEIEQHTRKRVSKSGLYLTLDRMQTKGLVEFRLGEPTPKAGGRAKRYYAVTTEGLQAASDVQVTFQSLLNGVHLPKPASNVRSRFRRACCLLIRHCGAIPRQGLAYRLLDNQADIEFMVR